MSQHESTQTRVRTDLEQAVLRLQGAVTEYHRSVRLGGEPAAHEELHIALFALFNRLRPWLVDEDGWQDLDDVDQFDAGKIWTGRHPVSGNPVEIAGLADLEAWEHHTATVSAGGGTADNPRGGGEERVVRLPAEAALIASKVVLDKVANSTVASEFEIAEDEGDAGFPYSDILEEGPPEGDAPQLKADGSGNEGGSAE